MPMPTNDPTPDGANSQNSPPQPSAAAMPIVWLALLGSVGMYAIVGLVVAPNSAVSPMPADQMNVISMMFAAMAIGSTAFAMLAPRILGKLPLASLQIMRWALAESIGIFGLLLRFMGGNKTWFFAFLAWSALLMLTLRPGQDEQRSA